MKKRGEYKMKKFLAFLMILSLIVSFSLKDSDSKAMSDKNLKESESIEAYGNLITSLSTQEYSDIPYAGAYIGDEGELVILIAGKQSKDFNKDKEKIKKIVKDKDAKIIEAEYTLKELKKIQDKITDNIPALMEKGVYISVVEIREVENRVFVGITGLKNESIKEVEKILQSPAIIFGEYEKLVDSSRTVRHNPLIGGIHVQNQYAGTLGFPAILQNGTVGIVLAGHVFSLNEDVYQPTSLLGSVGVVTINTNISGTYADAAFAATTIPVTGKIYDGYDISGVLNSTQTPVNTQIKTHGAKTNILTGRILAKDVTVNIDGFITNGLVRASAPTQKGDSGGPVTMSQGGTDGYNLLGIVSKSTSTPLDTYYVPYEHIKSNLGLSRPVWYSETK